MVRKEITTTRGHLRLLVQLKGGVGGGCKPNNFVSSQNLGPLFSGTAFHDLPKSLTWTSALPNQAAADGELLETIRCRNGVLSAYGRQVS